MRKCIIAGELRVRYRIYLFAPRKHLPKPEGRLLPTTPHRECTSSGWCLAPKAHIRGRLAECLSGLALHQ